MLRPQIDPDLSNLFHGPPPPCCLGEDPFSEPRRRRGPNDGRILATWGEPGRGRGQFDWVHGMAVDTEGAVYAADTYGQRVQKFVAVAR